MRLTWRDGLATVLAAAVVTVLVAVTQAWAWPLLGDYRAGVAVLAVIGIAMCAIGMRITTWEELQQPAAIAAGVLGAVALGLIVAGLIAPEAVTFVALALVILVLWLLTTADHALTLTHQQAPHPTA